MSKKPDTQAQTAKKQEVVQSVPFTTMARRNRWKNRLPTWLRLLPSFNFPKSPNHHFSLILAEYVQEVTNRSGDDEILHAILNDLEFLEIELQQLFRERDFAAKKAQNDHRLSQVTFMLLALLASFVGSLQALALTGNSELMPYFAFAETIVALLTAYIATTRGRKDHGQSWYIHRARAEFLRRELFRYLMRVDPYHGLSAIECRQLLSLRAAEMNRGNFPTEEEGEK